MPKTKQSLQAHHVLTWTLRGVAAVALVVDAYIHFDLAGNYASGTSTISQGMLFRIEGASAVLAAVLVLVLRKHIVSLFAGSVALGGLAAVLIYRYFDFGALGPLPVMYEPAWYAEKTNSAISQVVVVVALLVLFAIQRKTSKSTNQG